jgi:taurine dioxygenase
MTSIDVKPLQQGLGFGARIRGVTFATLDDEAVRRQINEVFQDRGLIVFEDVEPTPQMHLAISDVFGPLKEHPVPSVVRVDGDSMPGVIDMQTTPEAGSIVEIDGKQLASWLPWHFDHCYNNELNRAGVLRAVDVAPEGGLTGFADGIALYNDFPLELRKRIEGRKVLYTVNTSYADMRFGRPKNFRELRVNPAQDATVEFSKTLPRAVHPAVWTRKTGEKVLHVSGWMAVGLEDAEDAEGDALLEAVAQEIPLRVKPYMHQWKTSDMLIWDNWRMLHSVSGMDPKYGRRMQRTTIKGDYGLGYFENGGVGHAILEMTV